MFNRDIRYLGVFNGASYAPGSLHERTHVIVIPTLVEARGVLDSMFHTGRPGIWANYGVVDLDGKPLSDMPAVSTGDTLTLYHANTRLLDGGPARYWKYAYSMEAGQPDPYPLYVLTVGPLGGIHTERA